MSKSKRRNKAFTFIELLIVVAIIAVLAGISIPLLRKTAANFTFDNFVKDTYYLCSYLQSSSISEGKIYCLTIAPLERNISVAYKEIDGTFKPARGRLTKLRNIPDDISIINPTDTLGVYFYPDASISEMTLTLENKYNRKATLTTKGIASAVKIE